MNHHGASLTCCLAALASALPARAALDRAELIGLAASVLRVEAPRANGGFSMGSAVVVAPEKVITNCHVTRDSREVSVVRGGVRWQATGQASDTAHDLCLLVVPGLKAQAVRLGRAAALKLGQAVTALGYTGGAAIQSSDGEVVDLHRFDGSQVIQSSNWFSSGASGGGLFDDAGELVGVLTFRLRGGEEHYFAAPVDWITPLLDESERHQVQRVMPLDATRLPYWQRTAASQPRFLRAGALMRDDRWSELADTARDWITAPGGDPDDAEPWTLLGVALAQLGRDADARNALECALALDPDRRAARDRLARIPARGAGPVAGTPACRQSNRPSLP